ncbi:C4-dicarboxylate ABC transporter substrate-binding protein [Desulfocarbo indianensis]|nr:C4-dicarboxylate ABC transporter substrate-binding protein [Desulfocarbo indianensis]
MNVYHVLKELIQRITKGVGYVGMFLLIPMMLLISTEVTTRFVWDRPIPGTLELSSYMLSIFVLLGIAYTQQAKGHVRVTMLTTRLPRRLRLVLEMLTTILSLVIIAVLAWQGWVVGMEERAVSDMLRIPQLPFRLLVSVAGFLLALELLIDLVEAGMELARNDV